MLDHLLHGAKSNPRAQFPGAQEGKVHDVVDGGVRFTLASFPGVVFGPAPWHQPTLQPAGDGHTHQVLPPQPGRSCVVVFIGDGADRPWVVAW